MAYETEIVLTYSEFRSRAIPSEGDRPGTVTPCDIFLLGGDRARIQEDIYNIVTNKENVTLTLIG